MKAKHQESKGLNEIIAPADMSAFMFQYIGKIGLADINGHINFGADKCITIRTPAEIMLDPDS